MKKEKLKQNLVFLAMLIFTIRNQLNSLKVYYRFSRRVRERLKQTTMMTIPFRLMMNFLMRVIVLENKTRNQLIVKDDVSSLADESKKFASFLTIACKFNYTCVYIFTLSIQKNQFGERFFPKLTFSIFFQLASPKLP